MSPFRHTWNLKFTLHLRVSNTPKEVLLQKGYLLKLPIVNLLLEKKVIFVFNHAIQTEIILVISTKVYIYDVIDINELFD